MIDPYSATSTEENVFSSIARNLEVVQSRIAEAAQRANRDPKDIRLIAVSKTRPPTYVRATIEAGQTDFGENTIQDARGKIPVIGNERIIWHFIGHLQTNKAKFLPGNFAWLHSLDSLELATRISRTLVTKDTRINALIQVKVIADPGKHGVLPRDLFSFLERLIETGYPGIELRGLMTMGPYRADEIALRRCFAALRRLHDECRERFALSEFNQLSMGMSTDYREAIREGATMVRIGSAIFGRRT